MVMYFFELSFRGLAAIPVLPSNLCLDLLPGTMARIAQPTETPTALGGGLPAGPGVLAGPATALCEELWPNMRSKAVLVDVVVVDGLDAEASPAVGQTASGIKDTFSPPVHLVGWVRYRRSRSPPAL